MNEKAIGSGEVSDPLVIADVSGWRRWLDENEDTSDGVWLLMGKKGKASPTSITRQPVLEEALCSGWIDGQARSRDDVTYLQRYTPRRRRSLWSKRNIGLVARLIEEGRMRPRGYAEIDAAKADGRWERAYDGPATAQVPPELAAALDRSPVASRAFAELKGQDRYSILHQVMTAATEATRDRRIDRIVERLEQGRTS
ncbi:uncharacterized protein YdeI (YjbR/CyaY-like superfamily) [Stackebrandtia endophytica]|uniref:Uncharacterized protein YdeI (YjbR/CyaY-like superfamily) n=1 Tax=Stackebrandtia endophytica TaxID=1496996 RepID=A0A543AXT9_9ACTN|nr:YdeI/OmpD-associated family protein [Stackebrandtia endophytica]TQL77394.1 uncharacterized protein YdeI (YjbR/CyaY-like superfamily) [Stackebrandtia endophytica]